MEAKEAESAWQLLAAHRQVSASLKLLADLRGPQTRLSSKQAAILVSGIAGPWALQEDQTHALLLLSAMHHAQTPGDQALVREAMLATVHCIQVPLPQPNLICAACFFLGSTVEDLQPAEAEAAAIACLEEMQQAGVQLQTARLLPELLAGCALLLPRLRAMTGSWLLAVMLSMWCAPNGPPDQQDLQTLEEGSPGGQVTVEVMLPLYAALSGAGQSMLRRQAALESSAASRQHWRSLDMHGMVQLVSEALKSNCRRLQAAGSIAAAALLEAGSQISLPVPDSERVGPLHAVERCLSSIIAQVAAEQQPAGHAHNDETASSLWHKQLLLDSVGLCCSLSQQACGWPEANRDLLVCQHQCAWSSLLGVQQLHAASAASMPASAVSEALRRHLDSPAAAHLPTLLRSCTDALRTLPASTIPDTWDMLQHACRSFFEQEIILASTAPAGWMQAVDQGLRNQALDQLYMTNIIWLTGLWERTCQLARVHPVVEGQGIISSQDQASMAVRLLDSFGYLQPAHMRLSVVSKAVSDALLHVSSCPQAAEDFLLCLPTCSGLAPHKQEQLLFDGLAGELMMDRLQFLLQVAAPCLEVAPEGAAERDGVSIALSYLHSPRRSASEAAHKFLASCLQHAHEKEAISIAYLRGALQSYPAMTSELTLRNALETMLRSLPSSSLVPLLVLKHQANALQLAQARMLPPSTDSPSAEWQALMGMLSSSLLLISFQMLPDATKLMTQVLCDLPPSYLAPACQQLYATIAASNDHARKFKLLRWYQAMVDQHAQRKLLPSASSVPAC